VPPNNNCDRCLRKRGKAENLVENFKAYKANSSFQIEALPFWALVVLNVCRLNVDVINAYSLDSEVISAFSTGQLICDPLKLHFKRKDSGSWSIVEVRNLVSSFSIFDSSFGKLFEVPGTEV
jgi:hypothetical protein